jgi:hypothetical protein
MLRGISWGMGISISIPGDMVLVAGCRNPMAPGQKAKSFRWLRSFDGRLWEDGRPFRDEFLAWTRVFFDEMMNVSPLVYIFFTSYRDQDEFINAWLSTTLRLTSTVELLKILVQIVTARATCDTHTLVHRVMFHDAKS